MYPEYFEYSNNVLYGFGPSKCEWLIPNTGKHKMKFMKWWYSVNVVLKGRGLPEMLYGEAKDYWSEVNA